MGDHTLGDLEARGAIALNDGYRTKQAELSSTGVPILRVAEVLDGRIEPTYSDRVDVAHHLRFAQKVSQPGDIVVTTKGTVGRTARIPLGAGPFVYSPQVCYFRVLDPGVVDPAYLFQWFRSPEFERQARYLKSQTDMADYINLRDVRALRISLPAIQVQRSAAAVVSGLDDKIELNRKMAATLEEMARALFKSWFVDFDPVRAKAEGLDTGLPSEIADLFPDRLVDSDLGEVPDGWAWASLDRVANFLNGLALQKYPVTDDDRTLPVIKIAQLRAGATLNADRCSSDIPTAYVVEDGDVLFSWSGSLECAFWAGGRGALNQHLFKVTPNDAPTWLGYLGVQHHLPGFRETAAGKATTMGHIQRHHLTDARLPAPPTDAIAALGGVLQPMLDRSWKLRVESRQLTELRDALLPKLVSGAIRISDPEDFLARMEAAVA